MKRSSTDTIIASLKVLAAEVQSDDDVANAAIREAAERMAELQSLLREASGSMSYERWSTEFRKRVDSAVWTTGAPGRRNRRGGR